MADFKIVEGSENKTFFLSINSAGINMQRGIRQGFFAVGKKLVLTAREQMMEKPKTGKIYRIRRGKTMRNHISSAPGESPANLSGALRKSIGWGGLNDNGFEFGAGGGQVGYAGYLEDGTPNGQMKPRPLLKNSVTKNEATSQKLFDDAIAASLARVKG